MNNENGVYEQRHTGASGAARLPVEIRKLLLFLQRG